MIDQTAKQKNFRTYQDVNDSLAEDMIVMQLEFAVTTADANHHAMEFLWLSNLLYGSNLFIVLPVAIDNN